MINTSVPSPIPPWQRQVKSPQVETLTTSGTVSLTMDTTILDQTSPNPEVGSGGIYALTLPNGTLQRQYKTILVKGANYATTASFRVTGTFVGFVSLLFDSIGWLAVVMWDGEKWHWVGGNASQEN